MSKPLDIVRCFRALDNLNIEGQVCEHQPVHVKAIADAIAAIQANGITALMSSCIGVKNYASFGDQREDHGVGYGPKHGQIVFRIERTRSANVNLREPGADEIYLLEAVRDAGFITLDHRTTEYKYRNLADLLRALLIARGQARIIGEYISDVMVDAHEVAA